MSSAIPKHAVYAVCETATGFSLTFRIGQPVAWDAAIERCYRLDDRRLGVGVKARRCFTRWMRRDYVVKAFEVRAVNANGRGLGSYRHTLAFPIPYRALSTAKAGR